jgi:hypothetical protein
MTSAIPPFLPRPASYFLSSTPQGPLTPGGYVPQPAPGGQQRYPVRLDIPPAGALGPYPPTNNPRRHPVVTTILTIFTLLPLGLVLALVVTGFIWTPWQIHAFQAADDQELTAHYAQVFVSILVGGPLTVLSLTCGHFAAWLVWPDAPLSSRGGPRSGAGSTAGKNRIAEIASAVGRARAVLIVVLLISIAFGYLSILFQVSYLVWRMLSPEYI